jgi:uncharacterized membrane protein
MNKLINKNNNEDTIINKLLDTEKKKIYFSVAFFLYLVILPLLILCSNKIISFIFSLIYLLTGLFFIIYLIYKLHKKKKGSQGK